MVMTRPALFLDRDGVINREVGFVHRIEQFEFMPGIFECARWFQERGHILFVVTNQSGIGRGLYSQEQFFHLDQWMRDRFSEQGITISRTYHCPHHPEAELEHFRLECACRKPNPGMLLQAQQEFGVNLQRSVLIGDRETDIEAGLAAGVPINLLLQDGMPAGAAAPTRASAVLQAIHQVRGLLDTPGRRAAPQSD